MYCLVFFSFFFPCISTRSFYLYVREQALLILGTGAEDNFFYIQCKQLQYILLNYTTYKKLYPTTSTIPYGATTMTTSWQHKTGNTDIALHVTMLRREWKEIEENRTISWDDMKNL